MADTAAAAAPHAAPPAAQRHPTDDPHLQHSISLAEQLLQLSGAEAERVWEDLPDVALSREVRKHLAAIHNIASHLQAFGDVPGGGAGAGASPAGATTRPEAGEEQPAGAGPSGNGEGPLGADGGGGAAAGGPAAAGAGGEFSHLGAEGVDYTFGSVEDLDPSEWQVRCLHSTRVGYGMRVCYFGAGGGGRGVGGGHMGGGGGEGDLVSVYAGVNRGGGEGAWRICSAARAGGGGTAAECLPSHGFVLGGRAEARSGPCPALCKHTRCTNTHARTRARTGTGTHAQAQAHTQAHKHARTRRTCINTHMYCS